MSANEKILTKEKMMEMAADDIELLFRIVADLGYMGYKIARCKLSGKSLERCGRNLGITKEMARYSWNKCKEKGYDSELKRLFGMA